MKIYDVIIIGGGVAGLCLAIQLAKKKHQILLIEQRKYPFHKVCGEYVSMENWRFLEELGVPLTEMKLPRINTINISAPNGYKISSPLDMGGFGISRYTLDHMLSIIAQNENVTIEENSKVTEVHQINSFYEVKTHTSKHIGKIVAGSYGKAEPFFIKEREKAKANEYVAVKYHVKLNLPENQIELHNFKNGYCGISKVDNNTYCLCYLTTSKNLVACNNDIKVLEATVVKKNPHLRKYFTEAEFLFEKPLVISKIQFSKKNTYKKGILLIGDSAGVIAPLSGNGMSIAMRSSKLLAHYILQHLSGFITKEELIQLYSKDWRENFSSRIVLSKYLQYLFGSPFMTLTSLKILKQFPCLFKKLISLTHGNTY